MALLRRVAPIAAAVLPSLLHGQARAQLTNVVVFRMPAVVQLRGVQVVADETRGAVRHVTLRVAVASNDAYVVRVTPSDGWGPEVVLSSPSGGAATAGAEHVVVFRGSAGRAATFDVEVRAMQGGRLGQTRQQVQLPAAAAPVLVAVAP